MRPEKQPPSDVPSSDQEAAYDLAFPAMPPLSPALLSVVGDWFPAHAKRFDAVVERIANFVVSTARGSPPRSAPIGVQAPLGS